jgi:hypothetical protein
MSFYNSMWFRQTAPTSNEVGAGFSKRQRTTLSRIVIMLDPHVPDRIVSVASGSTADLASVIFRDRYDGWPWRHVGLEVGPACGGFFEA